MKNTIRFSMALCVISVLTACGGGDKSSSDAADVATPNTSSPSTPATSNPTSTPNPSVPTNSASSSDLIIDNGRGTSNNQDTESAED